MPESAPAVPNYLSGRLAVNVDQQGIPARTIQIAGMYTASRQTNALLNLNIEEFYGSKVESTDLCMQLQIALESLDHGMIREADESGN